MAATRSLLAPANSLSSASSCVNAVGFEGSNWSTFCRSATAPFQTLNLANLAPRKIDWDLKRDIAKKLEKLERRTQRAIVELIRTQINWTCADKEDAHNVMSQDACTGGY
ncbi:hypothetical protein EMCRGX_G004721 [Ephydatia muelleri]